MNAPLSGLSNRSAARGAAVRNMQVHGKESKKGLVWRCSMERSRKQGVVQEWEPNMSRQCSSALKCSALKRFVNPGRRSRWHVCGASSDYLQKYTNPRACGGRLFLSHVIDLAKRDSVGLLSHIVSVSRWVSMFGDVAVLRVCRVVAVLWRSGIHPYPKKNEN